MKHYPVFKAIWGPKANIENNLLEEEFENIIKVKEESENYYINSEHDKIFRMLLDDKEDVVNLLNEVYNESFEVEDFEKYNSSFVNSMFRNQEADVVYKVKSRNIFLLIEHQTKICYSMPFRLMEYQVAIMKSAVDEQKAKNKPYEMPIVIPIILYTGRKKWNAHKRIEEMQNTPKSIEHGTSISNIIDFENFTKTKLLKSNILIPKIVLLEKAKDINEAVKNLNDIVGTIKNERHKMFMKRYIASSFRGKMEKEKIDELINKVII